MLSRTADHLFWGARYMERAENSARILDVTYQTTLLPQSTESAEHNLAALLKLSELETAFAARYSQLTIDNILEFMIWDKTNPASIYSCMRAARENAHAVRGSVTTEVWETQNSMWLELQDYANNRKAYLDPTMILEWVKYRSHLSRGVVIGTMLKDDAWCFTRLGTFLERADNTARILDVKYLAEEGKRKNDAHHEFYHWNALLRSVSAFEIYRKVYRDVITPERVAELLILRPDMPRSLVACLQEIITILGLIHNQQSQETERRAGFLHAELKYARISDILDTGLHAYLTRFLDKINDLGSRISHDFLAPTLEKAA
ncbi:alpha-E domain-containing protein [Parvibium lacunae]|uniref:Alpha-E domain-containing protein n=1 Tax=Parvibium lacunae TaxID=1888893 RepID=A0A368L7H6_9BURK|nr:alpha-E domain-containing protein [Parvibium lacunae]RCS59620.1 alpha-E domain-containing protein [Parvibium lacunae]